MGSPLFDDRGISKKTGEKRQIMEVNKMDKNAKHYPLNVTMPQHCAYVVRDLPQATVEQRERALNATHWNEFAFPSGMLTVDMLSDSGTTAMTNQQWATLFLGDFSMEYDLKTPEQQAELANVVRFAIDRSRLTQEHLDYVIAAVKALYEDRESIPNMRIVWGHKLPMRHFHAFLEPYANEEK